MKRALVLLGILAAAVVAIVIATSPPAAPAVKAPGTLRVTASFYPLAYFASRIGGGKADVWTVTPAGAEPHDYEPTAQDAARMEDSDLLVLNGGGLEAWGGDIRKNLTSKTAVVTAAEGLFAQADPHVWLSPALASQMADKILAGFLQADPANAVYYQANAAALKSDLGALDADYRAGLRSCALHDIVTAHAAFGYLAAAYGLHQVPIAGLAPDSEPSPRQLADLTAFVRARGIKTVFFESLASPKLAETLAAETGAKTMVLDPLEGLTPSDLAAGKDYLSVMRSNLTNLRTALVCTSPTK